MAIEIDANVCGKSNFYVVRETKKWYLKHKKRLKIDKSPHITTRTGLPPIRFDTSNLLLNPVTHQSVYKPPLHIRWLCVKDVEVKKAGSF